jgi:CspA family cold shock protein
MSSSDRFTGERETGTVKWFNDEKGFGFVDPDDGSAALFVHFREIQKRGFKSLKEGERVSYVAEEGNKRPQASQVKSEDEAE